MMGLFASLSTMKSRITWEEKISENCFVDIKFSKKNLWRQVGRILVQGI